MSQAGYTPIQLYYSTTAAATPSAGNLANGEVALNITDGKLFYKDNGGVVRVLATAAGSAGDVVGPGSSTDNALVRFDTTTGKLVQNSVAVLSDTGDLTGVAAVTMSGALTLSGGTANGVAYLNGSKVLTTGSALTFDGTTLAAGTASGISALLTHGASSIWGVKVIASGSNELQFSGNIAANSGPSIRGVTSGGAAYAPLTMDGSYLASLISGSEKMRLTSTGLGIGTSSPGAKFVAAAANTAIASRGTAYLYSTNSMGANLGGQLSFGGSYTGTTETVFAAVAGRKENGADVDISGYLQFITTNVSLGPAERMRLDSSGNLGLGVTPSAWSGYTGLQVKATVVGGIGTSDNALFGSNVFYDGSNFKYINTTTATLYRQLSASHQWYTAPSGTAGNAISFTQAMDLATSSGASTLTVNSAINTASAVRLTTNGGLTAGLFLAAPTVDHSLGFQTAGTEKMRLDSSGNLLVGQTTVGVQNSNSVSAYGSSLGAITASHVSGTSSGTAFALFGLAGSAIGSITQTGTTGVLYNVTSDYRLKTVIGPVANAGQRIDALQPVEYTWNADGSRTRGFLAHQFQEVYAGSVSGTKDAVDAEGKPVYQQMQASTPEVIADLVAEIQNLRQRLAAAGI